jgi:hypothetical protein
MMLRHDLRALGHAHREVAGKLAVFFVFTADTEANGRHVVVGAEARRARRLRLHRIEEDDVVAARRLERLRALHVGVRVENLVGPRAVLVAVTGLDSSHLRQDELKAVGVGWRRVEASDLDARVRTAG